ncbi:MAG: hypothetical protein ACR2MG_05515 [Pyrinomonadaceae bacterium]
MKIIFNFVFIALFVFSVSAQVNEARKIDEFGNISCDDLTARFDNFFLQLTELDNSKGYVLVYEGNLLSPLYNKDGKTIKPRRGEAKAQILTMKSRIKFSRFDEKRIVFVNGRFRENLTIELWIVPTDVTPPKPTPTLKKMKYRKGKPGNFCDAL